MVTAFREGVPPRTYTPDFTLSVGKCRSPTWGGKGGGGIETERVTEREGDRQREGVSE